MQKLLLLIALTFFGSSTIQAAAPTPQKTAIPTLKITHTTVTTLPPARTVIKPSDDEIAWLKTQNESGSIAQTTQPKKLVLKPGLIKAFSEGRALQILVSARSTEDSFSLRIQSIGSNRATCTVRTIHEACPQWIETLIKQSVEQVQADARSRQQKLIVAGGIAAVGLTGLAYKKHLDEQRRIRAVREAEEEQQRATLQKQEEDRPTFMRYENCPKRTNNSAPTAKISYQKEFKRLLTTTPFYNFTFGKSNRDTVPRDLAHARNWCISYSIDHLDPNKIELTEEQFDRFINGSFAESTIDFLAQFQANHARARAADGHDETQQLAKTTAITAFKEHLQKLDPVEAKRVLSFHPRKVYDFAVTQLNWRYPGFLYAPHAQTGAEPEKSSRYYDRVPSFRSILNSCLKGQYCIREYLGADISMFEGLHLVSAAA